MCVPCTKSKAKQKNTIKESDADKATEANGRLFLDTSTIRAPNTKQIKVAKLNWLIMVDQKTGMKISNFFETKDGMVEPACEKNQPMERGRDARKDSLHGQCRRKQETAEAI